MFARIMAIGAALTLVLAMTAQADDIGGSDIMIPRGTVVEETIIETGVSAPPPPYVTMENTSLAAGIGLSWGDGTLLFEGQRYGFSVKGVSLVDLGFSKGTMKGSVANLTDLSDFAGQYIAVEASAAAGIGASALTMRNQHGVVISLRSKLEGAQLQLGPEGFSIALD